MIWHRVYDVCDNKRNIIVRVKITDSMIIANLVIKTCKNDMI